MTKAQAVTVVGDLVNAGYEAVAHQRADATWQVSACNLDSSAVLVATVQSFATTHGVTAQTTLAVFV